MASTSKGLFAEDIDQASLEELHDSEPSDCSSDDDSSGTDDLAVGEVIALECSDNEDVVQVAAAPSVSECYVYMGGHDKLCRTKRAICC
jgi:hypothetical protein